MITLDLGVPTNKQVQFINARTRHVAYGGARGGGKSWVVRILAILLCFAFPGIKVLIVRKSYPELLNNHINPLKEILNGIAMYNKQEKVFIFPNGSTIKFGYCASDGDLDQYQGAEYDIIFLEEATQLREEWIQKITACCRGVNSFPKRIYYTCNPGGVGHAYIKRLFVDKVYKGKEKPEDYTFIQALVTDNIALMESQPEYVEMLENLPPKLRKAWLEGSWDIFEGQFFEEFRIEPDVKAALEDGDKDPDPEQLKKEHRWTHVIKPFTPKAHWPIYRSFDWGFHRPFSMGYYTIDDDGVMYRICEFYGVQYSGGEALPDVGLRWAPNRVFAEIQQFENDHPYLAGKEIFGIADTGIWDAETGISVAETAAKYGLYFQKSDKKSRVNGWMQCHYRLMFDENGYPMFYVFDTCKEFIRTIPLLQYDEHKTEDLDSEGEDHIADEWRYMCMARPVTPKLPEEVITPAWGADPLDQFERRYS